MILVFIICWAPYHIYFIYSYHNPSITAKPYIGQIYLAFYWLAMSNTCVNPIIYYWMNKRFRTYFRQVFSAPLNIWKKWNQKSYKSPEKRLSISCEFGKNTENRCKCKKKTMFDKETETNRKVNNFQELKVCNIENSFINMTCICEVLI